MTGPIKLFIIGGGVLLLVLVTFWLVGRHYSGQIDDLKIENRRIADEYQQQIGIAKANELAAREEAMKAQALVAAVEQGNRNVKALDAKLAQAEEKHEQAKAALGECANPDDCLRSLCAELKAAGFKLNCE